MKLDDFYHSGFWDYCLHIYSYILNVLADKSSGLLQAFVNYMELRTTSFILILRGSLFCFC